jgi:hypothetical protein
LVNTLTQLNGWFKELYADQDLNLVPDATYLVKNVKFNKSAQGTGNIYHQPVWLTQEQGFTYAAAGIQGGTSAGAFALNSAVPALMQDAQITGTQLVLRSQIDYETLARAGNTKASFGEMSKVLVENMTQAVAKRLEIMFLYGRSPSGVGVISAGTVGSAGVDATLTVTAATWAPGLWAGMEGAAISLNVLTGTYPSQSQTRRQAAAATTNGGIIRAINYSTRVLSVSDTYAALATAAIFVTPTAGDVIFLFGTIANVAGPATISYNESIGLDGITSQTTGSLFNINLATYSLFASNLQASIGSTLTVTGLLQNLLPAIGKGLMDDLTVLVSHEAYMGLVNPTIDPVGQAGSTNVKTGANVMQNRSDELRFGAKRVTIVGHTGEIEIVPHLFVKRNDIFCMPKKLGAPLRVGATDVTFQTPGKGGEFFLHLPSNAGYEVRCYSNQALFTPAPGRLTKMTLT